jgi:YebC/PmpR family DNA-binding regulatory protein
MSGHNKWSKIKHQKASEGAKRSRIFSKMSRKITVAAREGGGDPDMNPSLALLVEKAKEANMPKDNIERAVKKGTGDLKDGGDIVEAVYEGYAPFGVAVVIKTVTDNKNRTVADIRTLLERGGGSLGTLGSASYVFDKDFEPTFTVPLDEDQYEKVASLLEDLDEQEDVVDIYANHTKA